MSTLTIRPDQITQSTWWANIGREAGITMIQEALKKIQDSSKRIQIQGTVEFYTWCMMSVWGEQCEQFGNQNRTKLFCKLLAKHPEVVQLTKIDRRVVLDLLGYKIDLQGIVGVSSILPVSGNWLESFLAGEKSLYNLSSHDLASRNRFGLFERSASGLIANVMINLLVIDKCLRGTPPHDYERYEYRIEGLRTDDFVRVQHGFKQHFADFLGDIRVAKDQMVIYRFVDGKKELGEIPRIIAPQTGKGMFDRTLPKFGFENYGKNKDDESMYVCDMNILRPHKGCIRIVEGLIAASELREMIQKRSNGA